MIASNDGPTTVGKRLIEAQNALRIPTRLLAQRAGYGKETITDIRRGRVVSPRLLTVQCLADALDIRRAWLAFGEGPMRDVK